MFLVENQSAGLSARLATLKSYNLISTSNRKSSIVNYFDFFLFFFYFGVVLLLHINKASTLKKKLSKIERRNYARNKIFYLFEEVEEKTTHTIYSSNEQLTVFVTRQPQD